MTTYFSSTLVSNALSQSTPHTSHITQPPKPASFAYSGYSAVPATSLQASSGHASPSGGTANYRLNNPVRTYRYLSNLNSLRSSPKNANPSELYHSWVRVGVLCSNASEYLSGCRRPMALRKPLRWQKNICSRGSNLNILPPQFRTLQSPFPRFRC